MIKYSIHMVERGGRGKCNHEGKRETRQAAMTCKTVQCTHVWTCGLTENVQDNEKVFLVEERPMQLFE